MAVSIAPRMTWPLVSQQASQPASRLWRLEPFKHPDLERPPGDRCQEPFTVRMDDESGYRASRRRKIQRRQKLLRPGLHHDREELPQRIFAGRFWKMPKT